MPSASQKGQYWQRRSRLWLEQQGYVVRVLQQMGWIKTAHGLRPVKRDTFGADLLAVSAARTIFVQCKGGDSRRDHLADARKEFARYPLGPSCQQWIVMWPERAREPEIEICAVGPKAAGTAVTVPPRRTPKPLPLFQATAR